MYRGQATVRRNRITGNGRAAIWILEDSGGTFENNDLRGNHLGAWNIKAKYLPRIHRSSNQE
jgi:parallel beta-helix repeat protein